MRGHVLLFVLLASDLAVQRHAVAGAGQVIASARKLDPPRIFPQHPAAGASIRTIPLLADSMEQCLMSLYYKEGPIYRLWGSWRPKKSLALFESKDGIHWNAPEIVLAPNPSTDWEGDINRPTIVKLADGYHLWYTGQAHGHSWIGYATSANGKVWKRMSARPVLSADHPWENVAVMCPDVIWDEHLKLFRMWYSGGEQYEPNAIGYATSPDGLHWTKDPSNPIFRPGKKGTFDQARVTGCQVEHRGGWYYMFYIGFRDVDHAEIGLARSRNGITGWQRHPDNPIVRPGHDSWDSDACYKPFAIFDGTRWLLWYNGRRGSLEQIGLVLHDGEDLGFGK